MSPNLHTAETVALWPVTEAQTKLARRLFLEGFAYAATEVTRLARWRAEENRRMAEWADYSPKLLPEDSLRDHAVNAALMTWEHGEHGHFAQGLAAGYYCALGQEL